MNSSLITVIIQFWHIGSGAIPVLRFKLIDLTGSSPVQFEISWFRCDSGSWFQDINGSGPVWCINSRCRSGSQIIEPCSTLMYTNMLLHMHEHGDGYLTGVNQERSKGYHGCEQGEWATYWTFLLWLVDWDTILMLFEYCKCSLRRLFENIFKYFEIKQWIHLSKYFHSFYME